MMWRRARKGMLDAVGLARMMPVGTVPVGVPRALVCSTAPGGSSAGVLSGSNVGVEDVIVGSTAEAAGCASFGSTAPGAKFPGGLWGSAAVLARPADPALGSAAAVAGGLSLGSAAAGSSAGALSGSTAGAGAGEILFGSTAADGGCASFGSTAVAGSSGALVSSAGRGRGRGSGGDEATRWR